MVLVYLVCFILIVMVLMLLIWEELVGVDFDDYIMIMVFELVKICDDFWVGMDDVV